MTKGESGALLDLVFGARKNAALHRSTCNILLIEPKPVRGFFLTRRRRWA